MITFVQTLISGLSLGSIYALIALGYTMVYGIAKMLNFAHGDIIMVGAYAVIVAVMQLSLPPVIAILISIIVCAVLGVVIERLAYKPLRQAQPLTVLITAIGVSYLLQNVALLIFGSEQKAFPTILKLPAIKLGQVTIDGITLVTLGVTAIIMIALTLFINKTKLGKAMRAVSEDKEAAGLMASAQTGPSPSPLPSAPRWRRSRAFSTARLTSTSSRPLAQCLVSRLSRQLSSAASALSPGRCWAAFCWA